MTSGPSVPELFEQVAARQPDASAVESVHESFSYDQLNRAANRIARAILARRGDAEEPVALLFGKHALVAAAMLGAVKVLSDFVVLDALPLNAGGKVDRRALPVPQAPFAPAPVSAQRGDKTAEGMLAIWREVFGVPLSPDEDFFALGGHSLYAGRIVAAVEGRFGVQLPPAALAEAPTVARLAAHIRALHSAL